MFIGSEWPHDLQAAITYLQQRPEVDANRIAAVGSSWGGGVTIYAAASDRRIRCAVSLGAPVSGERWLRDQWTTVFGEEGWQGFLAQVDADRARVAAGELSRTVRLIGGFIPVPTDQIPFYDNFLAEHTAIVANIPLEIAPDILSFAPETIVQHLSPTPLLIVHGTADPVVDYHHAEAYYERAGEPKKLCLIEGCWPFRALKPRPGEDDPYKAPLGDATSPPVAGLLEKGKRRSGYSLSRRATA